MEYILIGKEVFKSDHGSCAFSVDEEISHAVIAQTEPLTCVEAAFVQHSRKHVNAKQSFAYLSGDKVQQRVNLDILLVAAEIPLVGSEAEFTQYVNGDALHGDKIHATLPECEGNDVLILGNPDVETLTQLTDRMGVNGLLCWLPDTH